MKKETIEKANELLADIKTLKRDIRTWSVNTDKTDLAGVAGYMMSDKLLNTIKGLVVSELSTKLVEAQNEFDKL